MNEEALHRKMFAAGDSALCEINTTPLIDVPRGCRSLRGLSPRWTDIAPT